MHEAEKQSDQNTSTRRASVEFARLNGSCDELEAVLLGLEKDREFIGDSPLTPSPANTIRPLLLEFGKMKRLDRNINILSWWQGERLRKPHLFELSQVALAVPPTQVSVERLFSGLKFLIGHLRSSMKNDAIDAISLIRTNQRFSGASYF